MSENEVNDQGSSEEIVIKSESQRSKERSDRSDQAGKQLKKVMAKLKKLNKEIKERQAEYSELHYEADKLRRLISGQESASERNHRNRMAHVKSMIASIGQHKVDAPRPAANTEHPPRFETTG